MDDSHHNEWDFPGHASVGSQILQLKLQKSAGKPENMCLKEALTTYLFIGCSIKEMTPGYVGSCQGPKESRFAQQLSVSATPLEKGV